MNGSPVEGVNQRSLQPSFVRRAVLEQPDVLLEVLPHAEGAVPGPGDDGYTNLGVVADLTPINSETGDDSEVEAMRRAIVQQFDSTTIVGIGQKATVDAVGHIIIERSA